MQTFPALPAELTIYAASETHQAWLAWWTAAPRAEGPVHVDAHAVESVDGAGRQLLLSLARTVSGHGRALILDRLSEVLRAACRDLGAPHLLTAVQA